LVTVRAIVLAEFGQSAMPDFSICQYVAAWQVACNIVVDARRQSEARRQVFNGGTS